MFSSPELINAISNQLSARQPLVDDPSHINVAGPSQRSHPDFPGPENVDVMFPIQPVSSLPPISSAVMRRIRNGEFVEFECLLSVAPSSPNEFTVSMSDSGDSPAISLAPRSSRAKITDLNSWWLAWSTFIQVYLQFFPHRMKQVLAYQASITQFSTQFVFSDVYTYDRLFRQRMALEPHLKWDRFDYELIFRCLQRRSLPVTSNVVCYLCKTPGHYARHCEFQQSDVNFAGSSSGRGTTTLLSGLGRPHRHDHPVVGPSTIMVSAPTAVALSRMPAVSAAAHILHSCVDVPNFVLILWLLLIIYVLLCITCVFGAS